MFEVKDAPSIGPMGDKLAVIDEERGAWLQRIVSTREPTGFAFKLIWDTRIIPFEVSHENHWKNLHLPTDSILRQGVTTAGKKFVIRYVLMTFGGSNFAEVHSGLQSYKFKDEQERDRAILLAVEALLVFGTNYNGDQWANGAIQIELPVRFRPSDAKEFYQRDDFNFS